MNKLWQVAVRFLWNLGNAWFVARSWLGKAMSLNLFFWNTEFVSCRLSLLSMNDLLRSFDVLPFSTFSSREELWFIGLSQGAIDISKVNVRLVLVINHPNLARWILFKYSVLFSLSFLLLEESIQILIKFPCSKFLFAHRDFINIPIKWSPIELLHIWSNLILCIHFTCVTVGNNGVLGNNWRLVLLWESRWINLVNLIEM